jgi:NAD-dependent dihydropyrimidine dehydrogenase PreA subunit
LTQLSVRQVLVGERPAGLHGLDELFAELYAAGCNPDQEDLGQTLVARAREHNFIPRAAEAAFAQALLREYRGYVTACDCGDQPQPVTYATWRGYPREQIPWFPTVAAELCDGCGICLVMCRNHVFGERSDGKPEVVGPFRCEVGCRSCADQCAPCAISFPPRTVLDAFRPRA